MSPTPLQPVNHPLLEQHQISFWLKREDLNHPVISGNKWHKLKFNLQAAQAQNYSTLLSFGGPYSNHIYALAAAAKIYNFTSIGIIRGELHDNPTLNDAKNNGMLLHPISRHDYRQKNHPDFLVQLTEKFGPHYLIPEGGSNALAIAGCKTIIEELKIQVNLSQKIIACACGTGGTFAGLIAGSESINCQLIGFPVLKKGEFLKHDIQQLLKSAGYHDYLSNHWQLETHYYCGGYGKVSRQLIEFILEFEFYNPTIQLDPIYTAKLCYGLFDLIKQGRFKKHQTIIAIHTGGLQGRRGIPELKPI